MRPGFYNLLYFSHYFVRILDSVTHTRQIESSKHIMYLHNEGM